jgi:alkanesulfonate monooxygenase SsuD/methylene tetrahydromethanopterin reductase-like flavin-dependent oxidoreductase (luciferase family)
MRIGIVLPIEEAHDGTTPPYSTIREMAVAAEAGGLDSLWIYDHLLFRFEGEGESGLHEAWTILAAVSDATERVDLGTLVMCTTFRNPGVLAKMAATLDDISGGRLILGIGAGWHDPEYEAFGFPTDHKVGRFDEAFTIIRDLIRTGRADVDGTYVQARNAVLRPPARPDIPILVAAKRPRMLELTARHADAWNLAWFGLPDERLARVRGELMEACARVGRDPASLAITVGVNVRYPDLTDHEEEGPALSGDADAIAAGLAAHAADGADHVIAALDPGTPESLARFLEAVARYRVAQPAGTPA